LNVATKQGLYISGESLLHKLDPRVKVLSCLLLVVLAFAATDWAQLFTLIVTASIVFCLVPSLTSSILRLCWLLRWLLLFTLLMHLFFTPGRTLWGLSWLSLDGLLMGLFVCVQMLLAIIVSALLAITTSTEQLAKTFGWFVQPLQWMGCRTEEWQKLLLLTMDFIPIVQTEIRRTSEPDVVCSADSMHTNETRRWSVWVQKLQDLLARLVDRGDAVAHRLVTDDAPVLLPAVLSPLLPMALLDRLFSFVITLLIISYWLAG
jgi:energy-coupling factor transport system permease protein